VHRPGTTGIPSLLARVVDVPLTASTDLYGVKVTSAADPEDRAALRRAGQAAALSAVGRAVYAALVEWMQDRFDGAPKSTHHRDMLPDVIATYRNDALALDVEAVETDAPGRITNGILTVLAETQVWLRRQGRNVEDLHPVYEQAEFCRKGRRSRLTKTPAGRERRAEWIPEEHPDASPLHYRWDNVRRLLMDLQGTP